MLPSSRIDDETGFGENILCLLRRGQERTEADYWGVIDLSVSALAMMQ